MPVYAVFATVTGQGDFGTLRSALDLGWSLAASDSVSVSEADAARRAAELLVPDDEDDEWMLLSPLAQHAAAAVAYALRSWLTDDPQEAVWAARQLHEAADYLVQLVEASHAYNTGSSAEPLAIAARAIDEALAGALAETVDDLKAVSAQNGATFRQLLGSEG